MSVSVKVNTRIYQPLSSNKICLIEIEDCIVYLHFTKLILKLKLFISLFKVKFMAIFNFLNLIIIYGSKGYVV